MLWQALSRSLQLITVAIDAYLKEPASTGQR